MTTVLTFCRKPSLRPSCGRRSHLVRCTRCRKTTPSRHLERDCLPLPRRWLVSVVCGDDAGVRHGGPETCPRQSAEQSGHLAKRRASDNWHSSTRRDGSFAGLISDKSNDPQQIVCRMRIAPFSQPEIDPGVIDRDLLVFLTRHGCREKPVDPFRINFGRAYVLVAPNCRPESLTWR
jgi:hypothetical protein